MEPYYQDSFCTIYHGDCLELLPQMAKVDLVLTDPPYNLNKHYGKNSNDNLQESIYWPWLTSIFEECFKLMDDGYMYLSHSDKGIYRAKPAIEELGFKYLQTLVWWGKNGYSMQMSRKTWSYRHELILFLEKGEPSPLIAGEPGMWYTSVIEAARPQSNFKDGRYHATQKPLKLYLTLLQRTPGNIVLDPFLGSGTTLVAAKQLNRKAIGIEIEEKYCEIAANRLRQEVLDFRSGLFLSTSCKQT